MIKRLNDFVHWCNEQKPPAGDLSIFFASINAIVTAGLLICWVADIPSNSDPSVTFRDAMDSTLLFGIMVPALIFCILPLAWSGITCAVNHYLKNIYPERFLHIHRLVLDGYVYGKSCLVGMVYLAFGLVALYASFWILVGPLLLVTMEVLTRLIGKTRMLNIKLKQHIADKDAHKGESE